MKTQIQMFRDAERQIADGNEAFMEMLRGPNPLSPEEIDSLVARRPERWSRFAGFGAKAIAARLAKETRHDEQT